MSGYYLVKLHELTTDTSIYAIFIVRDDDSTAPIIVQASTNTWQAYNVWGDASLYGSFGADRGTSRRRGGRTGCRTTGRTTRTSTARCSYGAGEFFRWEYNFVRWAESQGFDMTYTTNVDVHAARRRCSSSTGCSSRSGTTSTGRSSSATRSRPRATRA